MTLDDLERKNRGFCGFFGDFGLRHTFQERQHSRETVAPSGVCKYIVPNVSCWIDELRLFSVGLQTCTAVARSPLR